MRTRDNCRKVARWALAAFLFAGAAFCAVGENGCHQGNVPHATYLAWLEDTLKMCERHGWGWALWNIDGPFGIMDTPRTDCEFEERWGQAPKRTSFLLRFRRVLRRYLPRIVCRGRGRATSVLWSNSVTPPWDFKGEECGDLRQDVGVVGLVEG